MYKIIIIFVCTFLFPMLQAMDKMEVDEELHYQLSKQEQQIESFRNPNLICHYCPPGGPPKLGVPLIGTEKLMDETPYGKQILDMTQEEKDQELERQLPDFPKIFELWHIRYHLFFLLQHGAQFTEQKGKESLLCDAVLCGDYMFAKFLLLAGADPNKPCKIFNNTAIFNAKNKKIAKLLVIHGADVHRKTSDDESVLHHDIWHTDDINLIRYFISQKVAIDSRDYYGNTVLHGIAIHSEDKDHTLQIAELFLYNGVPLDVKKNNGNTAEDILNYSLRKEGSECTRIHEKAKYCWRCHEKANLRSLLAMIKEQRERRAELPKQWRTFGRGWSYACKNEDTSSLSWLPAEIVMLIKEFVKAPPYKVSLSQFQCNEGQET